MLRVVAGVHHDGLAAGVGVDGVAGDALYLGDDDGARDAGQDDLPLLVGGVQPVGGQLAALRVHHPAVGIGDLELHPLQRRLFVRAGQLVDDQVPLLLVAELQGHRLSGLDLDCLGGVVQQVARLGPGFFDDQRGAGLDPVDGEGPRAVRHELAVGVAHHGAVALGHQELHVTQRRAAAGVHLLHQEGTLGTVAEVDLDHLLLLAGEVHGLGRGVNDMIPIAGQFRNDVSALLQPGHGKAPVGRSAVGADDGAARAGGIPGEVLDLEHRALDGLVGVLAVVLPHADGGQLRQSSRWPQRSQKAVNSRSSVIPHLGHT